MKREMPLILASIGLALLALCGCQPGQNRPASTVGTIVDSTGYSPDVLATLNSLERVDEYPLYVMHYQGKYSSNIENIPIQDNENTWGCTLFAALGDESQMLYGRNFDWNFSPALLLFTDPPDGYASVSMVDLTYLGFSNKAVNLAELPVSERQALLAAYTLPFDGMNEYGLVIGMAAVPASKMPYEAQKLRIGSIGVIREVLDHARTVDEAAEIMGKYNIDMSGGPAVHYLIADAGVQGKRGAKSVLVEFYEGKMVILPNDNPWHLATNHLRVNAQGDGGCYRYARVDQKLTANNGKLTFPEALQLLSDVSQSGDYPTQWSIVYGISSGMVEVVMGRGYGQSHTFQLPMADK